MMRKKIHKNCHPSTRTSSPVKVFLSAAFPRRDEVREIANLLRGMGHKVVSRWVDANDEDTSENQSRWALLNMADAVRAEVFIGFASASGDPGAARGGRHCELGAALALCKEVILIGKPEHAFHHHPAVIVCDGLAKALSKLRAYTAVKEEAR